MPEFKAALDYSWNEAAFAIVDKDSNVVVSENFMFAGHDASELPLRLAEAAAKAGLKLSDISEWTVGNGPGSFSGLRIASAFVMGIAYGTSGVRVRSISTAAALARSAFASGKPEKVMALFDGRRSEILAYGLALKNGSYFHDGTTGVFASAAELEKAHGDYALCALEKDSAAIMPFAKDGVTYAGSIRAEELIFNAPDDFSGLPTELVYLRAAVFVPPKTPRKII